MRPVVTILVTKRNKESIAVVLRISPLFTRKNNSTITVCHHRHLMIALGPDDNDMPMLILQFETRNIPSVDEAP